MEVLQKHFDTALESPDGIKKLRELILTLAMQGKFTYGESHRVVLGDVIVLISGQHLLANEQNENGMGIPYLTGPADFGVIFPTASRWTEQPKVIAEPGDILLTVKGAGVGKTNLLTSGKAAISRQLMAVRAIGAESSFIHLVLKNAADHFQATMTGIAIPGISRKDVLSLEFNLPSIKEQKRIVAKIDELMALCDKMEEQRNTRNVKRLTVHTAAINRLLTAVDKKEFDTSWQFITRHFDPLYSVKENVTALKKAILTLAMQGKLVKQDPKDQPASELLKESLENKPSELPTGWMWSYIANVVKNRKYSIKRGPFGSSIKKAYFVPKGYKVYEQQNAIYDDFSLGNYYIDSKKYEELKAFEVSPGDIIISCSGTVGKIAVAPDWMEKGIINQALLKLSLNQDKLTNEYFKNLFPGYFMNTEILSNLKGTAQKNIVSVDILKTLPFPLPPLAEQKRIVSKIDDLMALCDKLEKQIDMATEKQTALFDAVLSGV